MKHQQKTRAKKKTATYVYLCAFIKIYSKLWNAVSLFDYDDDEDKLWIN